MDRLASLLTEINPDHCPHLARIGKVNCTERSALNEERIFSAKEARPAFIINNALSTTAELPSYHFQRKIPSHRLH